MQQWQFWWNTLVLSSEHNPPRFVELMMLLLAMTMLAIWGITDRWPYLGLSLSYVVGSSTSILLRENMAPSGYSKWKQLLAVVALIASVYFFLVYLMGFHFLPVF